MVGVTGGSTGAETWNTYTSLAPTLRLITTELENKVSDYAKSSTSDLR